MTAEPDLYFDRRVPERLVKALAPGGPFHHLVELARVRGLHLDLHLRARGTESDAGHATLYLGLTRVIHLHTDKSQRFWIVGQNGKSFPSLSEIWQDALGEPQALEDLAETWQNNRGPTYVARAVGVADPKYTGREGKLQAALGRQQVQRRQGVCTVWFN